MAAFASAWLVSAKDGFTSAVYDKMRLVPFGEQAPIIGVIPGFQEYIMMAGSFQPGLDQVIFETSGTRFGVMICFESAFSSVAVGIARRGGQFISVITNDAWYDPSYAREAGGLSGAIMSVPVLRAMSASGPDQHLVQSIYRAVETRLPVVRCANTGISAVIEPTGELREVIPFGTRGTIVREIPLQATGTISFYARHGDWFGRACLLLTAAVIAVQFVAGRRGRRAAREQAAPTATP
jgi:apolipoprotein N-acyltransferase